MLKKVLFFSIFLLINYILYVVFIKKFKLKLHHYKTYTLIKREKLEDIRFTADAHIHFGSFNNTTNFRKIIDYLEKSNVLFALCMGIGQSFPLDKNCKNLSQCNIYPNITNDIVNAINYYNFSKYFKSKLILCMSMTFLDLAKPENIPIYIELFNRQFPKLFNSAGEVNLCKQAIKNKNFYIPIKTIYKWKPFMKILEKRSIPIFIHCDLGNNKNNTKYLYLINKVCELYPNNKIVWCHLGICPELTNISTKKHISILTNLLDKYSNLYCDISWYILYNNYFKCGEKKAKYIKFLNKYYNRILVGSDYVYSESSRYKKYLNDYDKSGYICQFLDNKAFRYIALGQNFIDLFNIRNLTAPIVI